MTIYHKSWVSGKAEHGQNANIDVKLDTDTNLVPMIMVQCQLQLYIQTASINACMQ